MNTNVDESFVIEEPKFKPTVGDKIGKFMDLRWDTTPKKNGAPRRDLILVDELEEKDLIGKPVRVDHVFNMLPRGRGRADFKRVMNSWLECDIRGFYDTVDHGVALDSLLRLASSLPTKDPGLSLDERAEHIFRAYLDCYTFPRNVLIETTPRLKAREGANASFAWPEKELRKHYAAPERQRIGVPQGGAISCVIANLVLDLADKRVAAVKGEMGSDVLYRLPAEGMVRYFWSAIKGTRRSELFSAQMEMAGFTAFEGVMNEARKLFGRLGM